MEAAQGGLSTPAVMAPRGGAGGVGGNLIANQLQKWKDRADEAQVHE